MLETTVGTFNPVAPLGVSLLAATVVVPSLALAVVDSETSSTTNLMFLTSLPSPRLISLTAPSFGSSPTSSVVPSSNSKWDFVMWSSVLGLS